MKKNIVVTLAVFFLCTALVVGQSKTTETLSTKFDDALTLYFYKNTLRMLNQTEDKEFDDIIKDIEKLKFMLIDKTTKGFSKDDYKKLLAGYRSEQYEEMMTSRFEGRNFDVYLKESGGKTKGMIVLANDSTNLYVLDMLGGVELSKVPQLFKTLDESSDITKKVKAFTDKGDKKKKSKDADAQDDN